MLTAITAVDNILAGVKDKDNIWAVNTEEEYHEERQNTTATHSRLRCEQVRQAAGQ